MGYFMLKFLKYIPDPFKAEFQLPQTVVPQAKLSQPLHGLHTSTASP